MDRQRYVVTGPPGSGKTTWCKNSGLPYYDLDDVAVSLGMPGRGGKRTRNEVLRLIRHRQRVIDRLSAKGSIESIAMIVTRIGPAYAIARAIGADVVHMNEKHQPYIERLIRYVDQR